MKSIAILTSGGDAPGMNAAIRAVTRSALNRDIAVFGVRDGWQGLIDDRMIPLGAREVGGIIQVGGTFLGSARSKEFREQSGRSRALRCAVCGGVRRAALCVCCPHCHVSVVSCGRRLLSPGP